MLKIEKTVFISYRRTDKAWALLVYKDLKSRKYDVFFDYTSIASGDFEQIIVSNIKARAHFILILTPTALDRCNDPGDWVRREIEIAMDQKRNIIPLLFDDFKFNSPTVAEKLTGKLSVLPRYNGLMVPAGDVYFNTAMKQLRTRFLNVPLDALTHPISSPKVREEVKKQQAAADKALRVRDSVLKNMSADQAAAAKIVRSSPEEEVASSLPQPYQLTLYPNEEVSLRSKPIVSPETLIRRVAVTERLVCMEPENDAIAKLGVVNQWLKVRDTSDQEGFVAAWYVRQANTHSSTLNKPLSPGTLTLSPTQIIDLRSLPKISRDTEIRKVPLNEMLICLEPANDANAKVSKNNQWLMVRDLSDNLGYVGAWEVKFSDGSTESREPSEFIQPGMLTLYPTEPINLRTKPKRTRDTEIRKIPRTEALLALEPTIEIQTKMGKNNQWLIVRDRFGYLGYVAAWHVTDKELVLEFKETLGSLAEEASSDLVQQELEAMSNLVKEMVESMLTDKPSLTLKLSGIAREYGSEIGRDTPKEKLNEILAKFPKTNEIKG